MIISENIKKLIDPTDAARLDQGSNSLTSPGVHKSVMSNVRRRSDRPVRHAVCIACFTSSSTSECSSGSRHIVSSFPYRNTHIPLAAATSSTSYFLSASSNFFVSSPLSISPLRQPKPL
jgi:hypothetical protein